MHAATSDEPADRRFGQGPVVVGERGPIRPRIGMSLKRKVVHVGQSFEVRWPLLNGDDKKSYGWEWTNKNKLENKVELEKHVKVNGEEIFTFKALQAEGDVFRLQLRRLLSMPRGADRQAARAPVRVRGI